MKKIVTVAVMLAVALRAFGCTPARGNPFDPGNGLHHNEITGQNTGACSTYSAPCRSAANESATILYVTDQDSNAVMCMGASAGDFLC